MLAGVMVCLVNPSFFKSRNPSQRVLATTADLDRRVGQYRIEDYPGSICHEKTYILLSGVPVHFHDLRKLGSMDV
jgi:hypothetical protein